MTLKLKEIKSTKDYPRLADDSYLARIVSVIDLGVQPQTDWQTKEKVDSKQIIMITFETPDEMLTYTNKDDEEVTKPHWISKDYPLSNHEKSGLMKLITNVKPDCTDLDELINIPCMITVGSTATGNAKITGVNKPMKSAVVGDLVNETKFFDFDEPNLELFNGLLPWIQKKIKGADNYNGFADTDSESDVQY